MSGGDDAQNEWQQGDLIADLHRLPVMISNEEVSAEEVVGAMIVTQTCDLLRSIASHPYIQLAGLREVPAGMWSNIASNRQPGFFAPKILKDRGLVVDFDVVATVAKEFLSGFEPRRGVQDETELGDLQAALARHRNRFAFPDDYSLALDPLKQWMLKGWKKDTVQGRLKRCIEQVRLSVDDWDNPSRAEFLCVLEPGYDEKDRQVWATSIVPELEALVQDWCADSTFRLAEPAEILLSEYRQFERLDFDAITRGRAKA